MPSCCSSTSSFTSVSRTGCELFKLLRVIGEDTAQTVVAIDAELPCGTQRIVSVNISTARETFHVFTDKVVKQGFVVVEVILVNKEGELATFTTKAPFMATVEIPGLRQGMEVDIQFHNLRIENDLTQMGDDLVGKVVIVEFVKVSEFVQRFLVTCATPVGAVVTRSRPCATIVCGH